MVGPHVALTAGLRLSYERYRCAVSSVAIGARADRAVRIRLANIVAAQTTHIDRALPLFQGEFIRGTIDSSFVVVLGKGYLFRGEILCASNRSSRRRGVTALEKLVIFGGVALATVLCREMLGDGESVMHFGFLPFLHLMAIQAVDALFRVTATLELVYDRSRFPSMASCAFARRSHKLRLRLLGLMFRTSRIEYHGCHNQGSSQDYGDED